MARSQKIDDLSTNDDLSGTEGVRSVELLDKTPEKWGSWMIQRERLALASRFS